MAASVPYPNRSASTRETLRPAAIRAAVARGKSDALDVTLLDLISAVASETEHDHEVIATVVHLLRSGRVRLCGNFRGSDPGDFES